MTADLDVIATRTLALRHEDGTTTPVLVRIGRPRPDSNAYRSDCEIEGLSKRRTFYAVGEDAVQALWLVLVGIGVDLRTSEEGKAGQLAWYEQAELGFPSVAELTRPEWQPFVVDGEELHWRRYMSWQQTADDKLVRAWTLEVARKPDSALSVGRYYPRDDQVGVEQALALVRTCKESGPPFL